VSILADGGPRGLRLAAAIAVAFLMIGTGYAVENTPPSYLDSATVVFRLPRPEVRVAETSLNENYALESSLITTGEAMTQILMSPREQRQIGRGGAPASVSMALVNLYDEEYPEYGAPLATLTAAAPSRQGARRAFLAASRQLAGAIASWQARSGVPPRDRISDQVIAGTGPVAQSGSAARVLAGLMLLGLVAVSASWGLIGARPRPARSARPRSARPRPAWPALTGRPHRGGAGRHAGPT
jgi:hypothetical protein